MYINILLMFIPKLKKIKQNNVYAIHSLSVCFIFDVCDAYLFALDFFDFIII